MSWNYENFLEGQLNSLSNVVFKVEPERQFLEGRVDPDKCYVSVKYLSAEVQYGFIKRQPINLVILGLPSNRKVEELQNIVNNFVAQNNFTQQQYDGLSVKQEYMSPVVLDGFMEVANTKRPVIYLSGTLYMLDNVGDLESLIIDGASVKPLSFNFSYVMTPNTQPKSDEYLASSEKSSASLSVSMQVAVQNNDFVNKVLGVANGTTTGNSNFGFAFTVNGVNFGGVDTPINMKLTSCQFTTAPDNVPTLMLGFMR